jgi:hypothetical protein
MRVTIIAILLAILAIPYKSEAANYSEETLRSWTGVSVSALVSNWGVPDKKYLLEGQEGVPGAKFAVEYDRVGNTVGYAVPVGNSFIVNQRQHFCKVTFKAVSTEKVPTGLIYDMTWYGNACSKRVLKRQ